MRALRQNMHLRRIILLIFFTKKSNMAAEIAFLNSSRHLGFFGKLFHKMCALLTLNAKHVGNSQNCFENMILIHHEPCC
jgi:hypothetical protein